MAQERAPVFVISRNRLLTEALPTQILREAEQGLAAQLQAEIDRTKEAFAREEADLTRRREEIPAEEMNWLANDFDRRARLARRQAQDKAQVLQTAFQEARARLVQVLPPILEELRVESGAVAILDADQALAIAPEHDLTDRAIALLNERVPNPEVPVVDITLELPAPAERPASEQ